MGSIFSFQPLPPPPTSQQQQQQEQHPLRAPHCCSCHVPQQRRLLVKLERVDSNLTYLVPSTPALLAPTVGGGAAALPLPAPVSSAALDPRTRSPGADSLVALKLSVTGAWCLPRQCAEGKVCITGRHQIGVRCLCLRAWLGRRDGHNGPG